MKLLGSIKKSLYFCQTIAVNQKQTTMSKIKTFTFDTPYSGFRKTKVHGYLRISGQAKDLGLCPNEEDAEDFYSFDITDITFMDASGKVHQLGALYNMPEMLDDTLTDCIKDATVAHMSYLFAEIAQDDTDTLTPTDMDKERNPSLIA